MSLYISEYAPRIKKYLWKFIKRIFAIYAYVYVFWIWSAIYGLFFGVLCHVIVAKVCGILDTHTAFLYRVQMVRMYVRQIFNKERWSDWIDNMNGHLKAKGAGNVHTKEEQKAVIRAQMRKVVFCSLSILLHDFHCQKWQASMIYKRETCLYYCSSSHGVRTQKKTMKIVCIHIVIKT